MFLGTEEIFEKIDRLEEENGKLRETVRAQGEFIQSLRRQIRDFTNPSGIAPSLGRAIADRGLRG